MPPPPLRREQVRGDGGGHEGPVSGSARGRLDHHGGFHHVGFRQFLRGGTRARPSRDPGHRNHHRDGQAKEARSRGVPRHERHGHRGSARLTGQAFPLFSRNPFFGDHGFSSGATR